MRSILLVSLLAAACSRSAGIEVHPAGQAGGPGDPATRPVLLRTGSEVALLYRRGGALEGRTWSGAAWRPGRPDGFTAGLPDLGVMRSAEASSFAGLSAADTANGVFLEDGRPAGWCPSVVRAPDGLHTAFDRFQEGDYDVIHRGPGGGETVVAGGAAFEAHPSLAADRQGRVWLAWDRGRSGWGLGPALHRARHLELAVLAGGRWHAAPEPWPDLLAAASPPPDSGWEPERPVMAELPRLVADEQGPLWVFYRVMTVWPPNEARRSARRVSWQIRAAALTDAGWSQPVTLPGSDGPNHDTLALAALPGGGVAAAWESDDRFGRLAAIEVWPEPVMSDAVVRVAELRIAGGAPAIGALRSTGRQAPPTPAVRGDPDPSLVPEGFVRLWGDLHRHSDLSRCKMDEDGSLYDQYRYARDVARLDFLAMTDHFQHITPPVWERLQEATRRFEQPGRFTTLYGFERAMPSGHRNMLCIDPEVARPAPFLPVDPEDEWAGFRPEDWVVIPHQLADRFGPPVEAIRPRPDLEPVLEIFQGRRGSYESTDAPFRDFASVDGPYHAVDLLRRGFRYGFIASSDHISSDRAFAAVLARENSRAAIFEALKARRTYAATTRMALDVRLGDLLVGGAGPVTPDARLRIRADAGDEIARVEVVRKGVVARSWNGPGADEGLLLYRLGRVDGPRRIVLAGRGVAFGAPSLIISEPEDTLEEAGSARVGFRAELDLSDDDGLVVPVRYAPRSVLTLKLFPPQGPPRVAEFRLGELEDRRPRRFRFEGDHSAHEIHLGPPVLGGRRFEAAWTPGDWQPGDWVYVRLVRADGEMAWSSPIWVDAPDGPGG